MKLKSVRYKGELIKFRKQKGVGVIAEAEGFGHEIGRTKKIALDKMKKNILSVHKYEKRSKRSKNHIGGAEAVMSKEWSWNYLK